MPKRFRNDDQDDLELSTPPLLPPTKLRRSTRQAHLLHPTTRQSVTPVSTAGSSSIRLLDSGNIRDRSLPIEDLVQEVSKMVKGQHRVELVILELMKEY
jgi:hypothetical protein